MGIDPAIVADTTGTAAELVRTIAGPLQALAIDQTRATVAGPNGRDKRVEASEPWTIILSRRPCRSGAGGG
jgi:hypothetical protein